MKIFDVEITVNRAVITLETVTLLIIGYLYVSSTVKIGQQKLQLHEQVAADSALKATLAMENESLKVSLRASRANYLQLLSDSGQTTIKYVPLHSHLIALPVDSQVKFAGEHLPQANPYR